jgi:hypothetical protein
MHGAFSSGQSSMLMINNRLSRSSPPKRLPRSDRILSMDSRSRASRSRSRSPTHRTYLARCSGRSSPSVPLSCSRRTWRQQRDWCLASWGTGRNAKGRWRPPPAPLRLHLDGLARPRAIRVITLGKYACVCACCECSCQNEARSELARFIAPAHVERSSQEALVRGGPVRPLRYRRRPAAGGSQNLSAIRRRSGDAARC